MRNLFLLAVMVIMSFTMTSCSETQVDTFKVKVAVQAEKVVESSLSKAYADVNIPGYSCADEVVVIGDKVYEKVAGLLNIKDKEEKGLNGAILYPVCKFLGEQFLPDLIISSSGSDYKCLKYIGADGVKKLSGELCEYISVNL